MTPHRLAVLTLTTALAAVALPGPARAQSGQPAPAGGNPAAQRPAPPAGANPAPPPSAPQGNPVNPFPGGPAYLPLNRGAYPPAGQPGPLGFAPLNGPAASGPNQPGQMPAYGPGAGQAGPGGWSPMPGSAASQGGGSGAYYPSATSGPYPNPNQAARITSTPSGQPPTEDTNRVLRLLRYANSSGGLKWPTALKILPPGPEVTQAREQIDNLLVEGLRESASGQVKPAVVEDLRREIKQLRRLWADRGESLPLAEESIQAGRDFLRRLEKALE